MPSDDPLAYLTQPSFNPDLGEELDGRNTNPNLPIQSGGLFELLKALTGGTPAAVVNSALETQALAASADAPVPAPVTETINSTLLNPDPTANFRSMTPSSAASMGGALPTPNPFGNMTGGGPGGSSLEGTAMGLAPSALEAATLGIGSEAVPGIAGAATSAAPTAGATEAGVMDMQGGASPFTTYAGPAANAGQVSGGPERSMGLEDPSVVEKFIGDFPPSQRRSEESFFDPYFSLISTLPLAIPAYRAARQPLIDNEGGIVNQVAQNAEAQKPTPIPKSKSLTITPAATPQPSSPPAPFNPETPRNPASPVNVTNQGAKPASAPFAVQSPTAAPTVPPKTSDEVLDEATKGQSKLNQTAITQSNEPDLSRVMTDGPKISRLDGSGNNVRATMKDGNILKGRLKEVDGKMYFVSGTTTFDVDSGYRLAPGFMTDAKTSNNQYLSKILQGLREAARSFGR